MPIVIQPTSLGKKRIVLGDDHVLECVLVWDDGTYPDLETSQFYFTVKEKSTDSNDDAVIFINSIEHADRFIIVDNNTGKLNVMIRSEDQEFVESNKRYLVDMLVVLSDMQRKRFIYDTIIFAAEITKRD